MADEEDPRLATPGSPSQGLAIACWHLWQCLAHKHRCHLLAALVPFADKPVDKFILLEITVTVPISRIKEKI
eukprot:CAMPEP_0171099142 /NCGR_PEP_ID=MMETSP0766_2-20121228/50575_1 /TAXON_ID=439317 /ORGANISM="Gambierdiscus australes, Strain CAWD 149" /LENGTH=71 /DNA_ID=CAMNT_0011558687 /DNA_START=828 /DNA_END=1043 /DNA_ORIENTATION=-